MKVLQQWIINDGNQFQLMVYIGKGQYYVTETGAFGQMSMFWRNLPSSEAEKCIVNKEDIPKDY